MGTNLGAFNFKRFKVPMIFLLSKILYTDLDHPFANFVSCGLRNIDITVSYITIFISILRPASVVHLGNRLKFGHCLMMNSMKNNRIV